MKPLQTTLSAIETIVREAGAIVREYHDRPDQIDWKGANDPVTAADQAVNDFLVAALRERFPHDAILAEESRDDRERLTNPRIWCVDPLDGTKEFIARNGEFSIMVGLAIEGEARLGVVYQPVKDIMYSGVVGQGAWLIDAKGRRPLRVSETSRLGDMRLVVSRSHRNPLLDQIKTALGLQHERISGSVGLKCGLIARREADLYLHPAPGIKEWDSAAPEAILRAAGGLMTDCWGRALRYNKEDVAQHGGLVASNGRRHADIIRLMAPVLEEAGLDPARGW